MTEKKKNVCLPKRLIASRKLIGNLAQNDFTGLSLSLDYIRKLMI